MPAVMDRPELQELEAPSMPARIPSSTRARKPTPAMPSTTPTRTMQAMQAMPPTRMRATARPHAHPIAISATATCSRSATRRGPHSNSKLPASRVSAAPVRASVSTAPAPEIVPPRAPAACRRPAAPANAASNRWRWGRAVAPVASATAPAFAANAFLAPRAAPGSRSRRVPLAARGSRARHARMSARPAAARVFAAPAPWDVRATSHRAATRADNGRVPGRATGRRRSAIKGRASRRARVVRAWLRPAGRPARASAARRPRFRGRHTSGASTR